MKFLRLRAVLILLAVSGSIQAQVEIGGISNSASYTGQITAGGLATVFGTGLGNATAQASAFPLPNTLAGVSLTIGSFPCPLLFVNATQINFQVPSELAQGTQSLILTTPSGTENGQINIDEAGPAIFQYGTNQAIAVNYSTGDLNADSAPVQAGDYLIVYLTGIGPLSSTPADGTAASGISSATDTFSATIGGVDAPVTFLGLAPGYAGLSQANIQVPNLANGDYPLVITVNNNASTSAVVSVSGTGPVQPNILTFVSSLGLSNEPGNGGAPTVQVLGQYAFVCGASQVTVVDVSNPQAPVALSAFGIDQINGFGSDCLLTNNYLIELLAEQNYLVFDLTGSVTNPTVAAGPTQLQVQGVAHAAIDGTTLLMDTVNVDTTSTGEITSESGSIEAYSIGTPSSPSYDGTYVAPSGLTQDTAPRYQIAAINNQYVAVAGTTNTGTSATSGQGVVDILDISNPADILGVTEVVIPGAVVAQEIAVQGTQALVVGNTQAFSNPLTFSGSEPQFMSSGNLTFTVLDLTNPQSPIVLGSVVTTIGSGTDPYLVSLGNGFYAISHVRSFAGVGGAGMLGVVDAIDPTNPIFIPVADIYGLFGMAVQDNYLYLATLAGLNIYQITEPTPSTPGIKSARHPVATH